jgi:DNA polymerase III alpha subunit (gram-positive type)
LKIFNDITLVVLDLETTGISAFKNEVIEIYMIKVIDNKIIDEYYSKFKPERELPLFISKLTG